MTDNLQKTEGNAALSCPFCGATPRFVDLAGWEVHCDCGVGMVVDSPKYADVLKAWNRRSADTCARHCEGTAYRIDARQQKRRADVLSATIRALQDVVTHDAETKADFVARVRAVLAADPDARLAHNAKLTGVPPTDATKGG